MKNFFEFFSFWAYPSKRMVHHNEKKTETRTSQRYYSLLSHESKPSRQGP